MSKLWPVVTKQNPCPICRREDWCTLGDFAVLCQREPSDHPFVKGGWFHAYTDSRAPKFIPPKRDVAPPLANAEELALKWYEKTPESQLIQHAQQHLGIASFALDCLLAGYSPEHKAWSFPMRDGDNKIIGIRLRNEQGDKWAVKGSRQGLFIPTYFEFQSPDSDHSICYVTEGPTDCAACLSIGLYSIGRPSCNANADQLKIALKNHKIRRVVIIADNDDKRRPDGRQWSPGIDGAKALGSALKMPHVIWIPPCKDVREFVRQGGTRQQIESAIKKQIWKR